MPSLALLGRLFLKGTLWVWQEAKTLADELPLILASLPVSISKPYKNQLYIDALTKHLIMPPIDMAETDTALSGMWQAQT